MKKFGKLLSLLLTMALVLSLAGGAFASSGEASGEASGSSGADISGMLALSQYVFVASQGEIADGSVAADYYGVYTLGGEGEAAYVPAAFDGDVTVYADSALQIPAEGVSVSIADGSFTMTGVAEEGNTAYYLSTGEAGYTTVLYVVCEEYEGEDAVLTLSDGTELTLTTYAPNMRYGDYDAVTDANAIEGDTSVYVGGNRTAVSLDELTDTENFAGYETEVAWYLRSGITNAGDTLTTFGDKMYGYEYAVSLYRLFQIVVDQVTSVAGFVDPGDFVGAMFSNDPYSDAVSATIQGNIWNGIYTQMSDVKDLGEGFYLTENIEGVENLGTGAVITAEFAYVGMYNAFASDWTTLNEDGFAMAETLEAAAAEFDGGAVERPADYTNEAKMYAVAVCLMGLDEAPAADTVLTKAEGCAVLYAAKDYVMTKTAPDASRAERTGSAFSDLSRFFGGDYGDCILVTEDNLDEVQAGIDDADLISEEGAAILINNAGSLTITNNTVSLVGNADVAVNDILTLSDARYALDGQEAATDPTHDGFVYNATSRNAFYRFAVGAGMAVWGKNSVVNLRSDNGTIVLDAEASGSSQQAGNMAGGAYVGFGGTLNITNAVAYSGGQHLTNILYNGSVHYLDAYAVSSGRVYSSDFWGGYQVFEDSVATGGCVTDEPTTLICKNSVFGNSLGGNGFASQYFENCLINASVATFQNTTSLVTDCGGLTLVNSVLNGGSSFAAVTGCERAIITVVDSDIVLTGNTLATVGNHETVNAITDVTVDPANLDEYVALWDGEMAIRFYGENNLTIVGDGLTVSVAEGGVLTVYSANLTEDDIVNTGAGELIVVTDDAYGTVNLIA